MTDRHRTPATTLRQAYNIGLDAGLNYVYEGNVQGNGGENTYCPSCKVLLVERYGFTIESNRAAGGICPDCNCAIAGVWL
jgi:pyruvate formate lyase activating enzyme